MLRLRSSLLLGVCLLTASPLAAGQVEDLVHEGVRLHDEGQYQEALEKYRQALALDEDNVVALAEMGHTAAALKDYETCIEVSKRALKLAGSSVAAHLYAQIGNCHSVQGQTKKALKAFRAGLQVDPEHTGLLFNISITLAGGGQVERAIHHLKAAVETNPLYPSPYFLLGDLYPEAGYRMPGLFAYMRAVMLEPNSGRAVNASRKLLGLARLGVSRESEKDISITLPGGGPTDEGDFQLLETMMALSQAAVLGGLEEDLDEIGRSANGLTTFIDMVLESGGKGIDTSFTWKYTANPVLQLRRDGHFECFAYILLARAGETGAQDWLEAHPEALKALNEALARGI